MKEKFKMNLLFTRTEPAIFAQPERVPPPRVGKPLPKWGKHLSEDVSLLLFLFVLNIINHNRIRPLGYGYGGGPKYMILSDEA